jgi:hypothetical protein
MDVTTADIARIPAENIHVPRDQFAAVWTAAERHQEAQAERHVTDWYNAGVVVTCRWLARATVRPEVGRWYVAQSPVTRRSNMAYAELVQAEALAAEVLDMRRPVPAWLAGRPGWMAGILATMDWVWWRKAGPPVEVEQTATG